MQHVSDDEQNFTWFHPVYEEQIDIFIQLNKIHNKMVVFFNLFSVFFVRELN